MTHTIHSMHFGSAPTPHKYHMLRRLHPRGLSKDWLDKLQGQGFFSESSQHTHEHYLQVRAARAAVLGHTQMCEASMLVVACGACQHHSC